MPNLSDNIIAFNQEKHRGEVSEWLRKREHPTPGEFPKVGFIIEGVCCGFLRMIEGGYALIDGYASNPDAAASVRDESLNLLTKKLILEAQRLEIKHLFAMSVDVHTIKRASDHGFLVLPYAILALDTSIKAKS